MHIETINEKPRSLVYSPGLRGAVERGIDGVLGMFFPVSTQRRIEARAASRALLNYDAALRKRTRRDRKASSPDNDLLPDLAKLRENARACVRDETVGEALVSVLEDNVVGTGLQPQVGVDADATGLSDDQAEQWINAVERFWFGYEEKFADATGHDTFGALQRLAFRHIVVDGEAILHRVTGKKVGDGRLVGTAFELIDPDRLVDPDNAAGGKARGGIEVNEFGEAIAYWITPHHPEEMAPVGASAEARKNAPRRLSRDDGGQRSILHAFVRKRASQRRGVPWFAPAFEELDSLGDMIQSELVSARAASKFCGFIKQTLQANAFDPTLEQQADGSWHEKLESGTIRYLNHGEDFVGYSPNRPGGAFEPFVIRVLRQICAALHLPYELVIRDFQGMNYSNARVLLLEARRSFEVLQQHVIVPMICEPVFRAVIADAIKSKVLKPPAGYEANPGAFLRVVWQPPAWGWVDPTKEIEAAKGAIDANLTTFQAEIRRQGMDEDHVLDANARSIKKARKYEDRHGLPEGSLTQKGVAGGVVGGGQSQTGAAPQAKSVVEESEST